MACTACSLDLSKVKEEDSEDGVSAANTDSHRGHMCTSDSTTQPSSRTDPLPVDSNRRRSARTVRNKRLLRNRTKQNQLMNVKPVDSKDEASAANTDSHHGDTSTSDSTTQPSSCNDHLPINRRQSARTVCNKRLSTNRTKHHTPTRSKQLPVSCTVCEQRFLWHCHLKTHMRSHTGERPFSCDVCKCTFTQMDSLKRHMCRHTGVKSFGCTLCSKTFVTASDLKCHVRIHTGERPYACGVCQSTFTQSGNLKAHMLIHSGDKPNSCYVCEKRFRTAYHLKRHIRTHAAGPPFVCEVCRCSFAQLRTLRQHMAAHQEHAQQQDLRLRDQAQDSFLQDHDYCVNIPVP